MSENNNKHLLLQWWLLTLNIMCLCFSIYKIRSGTVCVQSLHVTNNWHTNSVLLIVFDSFICLVILIACYVIVYGNLCFNIISLIVELLFWLLRYMLQFLKVVNSESKVFISFKGEEIKLKAEKSDTQNHIIQVKEGQGLDYTYNLLNINEKQRIACAAVFFDTKETHNRQQYVIQWFQLALELNTLLYTSIYCYVLYSQSQRKLRNKHTKRSIT